MLKEKKIENQRACEEYIEDHKLYEVFEDMMKSLIVHKPEDPVKFLIEKIQKPETTRIVLMGPPGSKRKETALGLAAHFTEEGKDFQCISVGDLIKRQVVQMNQTYGQEIESSLQTYSYVKDDIVIKLVRQQIELMEQDKKSWIIEGFPRTEAQAIAFQKMSVMPDKFILLTQDDATTFSKVIETLTPDNNKPSLIKVEDEQARSKLAANAVAEYNLHIKGLKRICQGFVTEMESNESEMHVVEEIVSLLKLKNTNAPRRPQRIILMGPAGSHKKEYALALAEKYQLVYVNVNQLIKEIARRNGDNDQARALKSYIAQDRQIPDEVAVELVLERLSKPDCRLNGWILDGCPSNLNQIRLLQQNKVEPQKVIALEISDEKVMEELSSQLLHRESGKIFTQEEAKLADSSIQSVLLKIDQTEQKQQVTESREFLEAAEAEYSQHLVRIDGEESRERIFISLCDAIESSL